MADLTALNDVFKDYEGRISTIGDLDTSDDSLVLFPCSSSENCSSSSSLSRGSSSPISPQSEGRTESLLEASYKISDMLASGPKPYSLGNVFKRGLLVVLENIAPDKVKIGKKLCLSPNTIATRVQEMADDVVEQLRAEMATYETFAVAFDESTDKTDISELVIYIRGVDIDNNVYEHFLELFPLLGTTKGLDVLEAVCTVFDYFYLLWKNCESVTARSHQFEGPYQRVSRPLDKVL